MVRIAGIALFIVALACATPASAQWIFGKKSKVNPTQRVPELILTLKTDGDERKRAQAAAELRDFDVATFTEIVPALADVLLNDKKANVRLEALTSLGKIRPVNTIAGHAMEKAAADDDAMRVRLQAKTALAKYYLAGYAPRKNDSASVKKKQTEAPPVAAKTPPPLPKVQTPTPSPSFPRPLPPGVAFPADKAQPAVEGPSLFPKGS